MLIYPKAVVSIVLDLPRAKKCYIVVKTKILNDVIELGRTESLETTEIEPLEFKRTVEVTYYTGIDDDQKAIFEVMDSDIMASSAFGYLFYTVVRCPPESEPSFLANDPNHPYHPGYLRGGAVSRQHAGAHGPREGTLGVPYRQGLCLSLCAPS